MMNNVILIGRITKDVELRKTRNATSVVEFNLAVPNVINKQADGKPSTDFISCVAWANTAEIMEKYVKKGNLLAIKGHLQTRYYENKEGTNIKVTEVIVESIVLLEKNNESQRTDEPIIQTKQQDEIVESPVIEYNITDDDIPF